MVSRLLLVALFLPLLGAVAPSPEAKVAFDRGEQALAGGRLDEAITAYRDSLAATPSFPAALNGLGSVLFKQGKKDEAMAQFKAAIAADPEFKLAYFNLGYAARKSADLPTAQGAYERYIQLEPSDPDGYYGLADTFRLAGKTSQAIDAYERYLAKEKRPDQQKWVDKARDILAGLKAEAAKPAPEGAKPVETAQAPAPVEQPVRPAPVEQPARPVPAAVVTFAPAATGTPPSGGFVAAPATVAGQLPQPVVNAVTPAQAQLNQAQPQSASGGQVGMVNPSLAARRIADGNLLMADKKFRDASFAFQDAVNADPTNVEALFNLGRSYAVLGYFQQAIERWERVIQVTGDPAVKRSAHENIARAQEKITQLGGGSPQAQGLRPGSGPVADRIRAQARQAYEDGVRLINQRDYAGALKALTEAIRLEPTLTVGYVARGSANIGLRRYPEAAADYQYASRLDTSMASPLYGLAEAYRAMGRGPDAREYYERYIASTSADVRPELQQEARAKVAKLR